MKKILFFWILFAGIFSVNAQTNYFYDSKGSEVHFKTRKDMILIKAAENVPVEDIVKNSFFTKASATHKQFVIASIDTLKTAYLCIYDLQGAQLKQMTVQERGEDVQILYGSELKAGIYLYTLIADGQEVDTKRMILTK
jgi:myo-inositol-hexaphosphate 3-phosphohydrolase